MTDESLWWQLTVGNSKFGKVWSSPVLFYGISAGRDTGLGHLSVFPAADIHFHSHLRSQLRSKLGQLAVSKTWLTCGCCTCSSADLFNPSALFLHTSPDCWQLSQKGCELGFSVSWLILLLQLSPAHLYLQHHVSPPVCQQSQLTFSCQQLVTVTVNYLSVWHKVVPRILEVSEGFC